MIRPWKRTMVTMTCNLPVSLVQRISPDALVCTLLPSDESVHIFLTHILSSSLFLAWQLFPVQFHVPPCFL